MVIVVRVLLHVAVDGPDPDTTDGWRDSWGVTQGAGNPPTVFYLSLNGDAPDRADRFAEFDTMLASVSFG